MPILVKTKNKFHLICEEVGVNLLQDSFCGLYHYHYDNYLKQSQLYNWRTKRDVYEFEVSEVDELELEFILSLGQVEFCSGCLYHWKLRDSL